MVRVVAILMSCLFLGCDAFIRSPQTIHQLQTQRYATSSVGAAAKSEFLESLKVPYNLNNNNPTRTELLQNLINSGSSLSNPGRAETFSSVAPGSWKVVYAPHMTIMAGLFKGEFDVQYDLKEDGTITSHARYNFPLFNLWGYLSVSGTYGSVNDQVCCVDFNEAWIKTFSDGLFREGPYRSVDSVPASLAKGLIRAIGRALFIEPFAVFPISYLDNELIVFDFELLGTRICARKE